ncbi:GntR family transcriptional regulator [Streptomyces sp. AD2-2]|nr:GntR family transcriptional regulator [Streptomyces sp. AD2-2]
MTAVRLKHQRITEVLAKEIRGGHRPAGEQLPGEHALAQRFGVSRTTVRAALAELAEAGLIATRTGKGSYVLFDGRPSTTASAGPTHWPPRASTPGYGPSRWTPGRTSDSPANSP